MDIPFSKYHGTGNDFILIDNRSNSFNETDVELIRSMCSRRFGIGADGLILLQEKEGYDFQMVYFNSDGKVGSMCGNGGRCIVQFGYDLGLFQEHCRFLAFDGEHVAEITEGGLIKLKMNSVDEINKKEDAVIMDTGSPHYITFVDDVESVNVKVEGSSIRYSDDFNEEGINVNFVQVHSDCVEVATYERGVEDETYSCGTGVTAAALAVETVLPAQFESPIKIITKGGSLLVHYEKGTSGDFQNVWLEGPAVKTFEGVWTI